MIEVGVREKWGKAKHGLADEVEKGVVVSSGIH